MSSRVKLDSDSEGTLSSENSLQETPEEVALEDPMYYILGQYLENDKGENIATILSNLVKELTLLRVTIENAKRS
jgi:hypothetical protein